MTATRISLLLGLIIILVVVCILMIRDVVSYFQSNSAEVITPTEEPYVPTVTRITNSVYRIVDSEYGYLCYVTSGAIDCFKIE